jgi:hypothetical protein
MIAGDNNVTQRQGSREAPRCTGRVCVGAQWQEKGGGWREGDGGFGWGHALSDFLVVYSPANRGGIRAAGEGGWEMGAIVVA